MKKPIAIQLYSVRNEMKEDFEGTLKKIHEIGYDGVEFAGLFGHSPEEIHDICKKYDLIPISAHVPYADIKDDIEKAFSIYETIGCKYVAFPSLDKKYFPGGDQFEFISNEIAKISSIAKNHGISLLYHNHDFEFEKIGNNYKLDLFYSAISKEYIGTEIDVCWANIGGVNPAEYLRKYAGRVDLIHIKDFFGEKSDNMYDLIAAPSNKTKRPNNFEYRPVGHGLQNIFEILQAAIDIDAKWLIVEQDHPSLGLSPLECAKESIDYLRKYLG